MLEITSPSIKGLKRYKSFKKPIAPEITAVS